MEEDILARNDAIAAENRAGLAASDVLALNLVSSPGSGKTELLDQDPVDPHGHPFGRH
ncbi:MAG: hypothetical protein V8T46_13255 [Sutterella seckii]